MIRVYTDGSCDNIRDKVGSNIFVVVSDNDLQFIGGNVNENSTNNREELEAVINAMKWLNNNGHPKALILTDSQYVKKGFNEWIYGWSKRDFANVKNDDLWRQVWDLKTDNFLISVEWVRGHNGDRWNELADKFANDIRKTWLNTK